MKPETAALLRKPFEGNQISRFPSNAGKKAGLHYVGHAAVTDRLLKADPRATWEFFPQDDRGTPIFDSFNGIWCRLTIDGVTRTEYGAEPCTIREGSPKKTGKYSAQEAMEAQVVARQSAMASALTRAAMRFGVALDLWHKGGDLYQAEPEQVETITPEQVGKLKAELNAVGSDIGKFTAYIAKTLKVDCLDSIPANAYQDVMAIAKRATAAKAAKAGA